MTAVPVVVALASSLAFFPSGTPGWARLSRQQSSSSSTPTTSSPAFADAPVIVRTARTDELTLPAYSVASNTDPSRSVFTPLSELCARNLFAEHDSDHDQQQLAREMSKNLQERYSPLNPRPHVLLLALDADSGDLVGSCGVEAAPLTPEGRGTPRLPTDAARMRVRPLLSNLVVEPTFRRRGVATRLMREAEQHAANWGFQELMVKVEASNRSARRLYRGLGYRVTAEDKLAERPEPGVFRVRWVRTSNLVLRKRLGPSKVRKALSNLVRRRSGSVEVV